MYIIDLVKFKPILYQINRIIIKKPYVDNNKYIYINNLYRTTSINREISFHVSVNENSSILIKRNKNDIINMLFYRDLHNFNYFLSKTYFSDLNTDVDKFISVSVEILECH